MRKSLRLAGASVLTAATLGLAAPPAFAQQAGLVNVEITNLLNNNNVSLVVPVQAAIPIAANICGVNAAVLAADFAQDNQATCTNEQRTRQVELTEVTQR